MPDFAYYWFRLLFLIFLFAPAPLFAHEYEDIRIDLLDKDYVVNHDNTYKATLFQKITILTDEGINQVQQLSQSFFPESQRLNLMEARVVKPDGMVINVSADNIFTRDNSTQQGVPGFSNSRTTTVIFPRLQAGCRIMIKWEIVQQTVPIMGVNIVEILPFNTSVGRSTIKITLPIDKTFNWQQRGGFVVKDRVKKGKREITAVYTDYKRGQAQPAMIPAINVCPAFCASTFSSWEEIGSHCYQAFHDKTDITAQISELAAQIAGNKRGLAAARALYYWVVRNIHYVSIRMNAAAGYIPHDSKDIIKNGYGDCKDQVALMAALLKARNIKALPALVSWGYLYRKLPTPVTHQFNHIVLYLPDFKIYLNPTSPYSAFGELDNGLYGQFVVMASEHGDVDRIPPLIPENNHYTMQSVIAIDSSGEISGSNMIKGHGPLRSDVRRLFLKADSPDNVADTILAQTRYGGFGSIKIEELNNLELPVILRGSWRSPHAFTMKDIVCFNTPVGIDLKKAHFLYGLTTKGERKYPILLDPMEIEWKYEISLPKGYELEIKPEDVNFVNRAGSYRSVYRKDNDKKIRVWRKFLLAKGLYSAAEYSQFLDLIYQPITDFRGTFVMLHRAD